MATPRRLAASRADAARALGFAHAQERFFQMDLMRRNAAGGPLPFLPGETRHRLVLKP
ncbi:MAG: penicillin acylase family protein [Roseateles sp.]|uniref:penicillin acylase family protein n=1 Tax=Roseateles sp. TaxID=1971397 RepID=UPI0039EAF11C